MTLLAFFGMPGHIELIIIGAIILLLFGHRLPSVMRSLGGGINEFKKGLHEDPDHMEDHVEEKEQKQA